MANFIPICLVVLQYLVFALASKSTQDYSWRDYDGHIPADAFIAGLDKNRPVYVGQVLHENQIIPGKIFHNDKSVHIELNGKTLAVHENAKILCSESPENFKWISTTTGGYNNVKRLHLINGGYEQGYTIHVGKVFENGRDNIGKVVCREENCLALYTSQHGKVVKYFDYYILAHDPVKTK